MIRYRFLLICVFCGLILITSACTAPAKVPATVVPAQPTASEAPTVIPPASTPTLPATATPTTQVQAVPTAEKTPIQANIQVPYRVILVKPGDTLTVHQNASVDSPAVASLAYDSAGIRLTGRLSNSADIHWNEISLDDGSLGWVNGYYLTEDIDQAAFCADSRLPILVDSLKMALIYSDGDALKGLISPVHGLFVQLYHSGNIASYSPEEAGWVFKSTYQMDWGSHPASGLDIQGSFSAKVLPDLLDVFEHEYTLACMDIQTGGINYPAARPPEFTNVLYFSANKPGSSGVDLDWRSVVLGIEYAGGQPYLLYLQQFFWEP